MRWLLISLLFISGCALFSGNHAPHTDFYSADVLRSLDEEGISRNDECTLTDPARLAALQAFFPEILTKKESTLHAAWIPWIVIRFRYADGTEVYVESDYRIYRMGDGKRGDFVLKDGLSDLVNGLPLHPHVKKQIAPNLPILQ